MLLSLPPPRNKDCSPVVVFLDPPPEQHLKNTKNGPVQTSMKQVQQVHLLTEPTIAQTFNRITNLVPLKFQSYHMLQLCWAAVFVSTTTNNNNNNKVQTKTATPLHHIFFLFLYKGVETNSATPSLFFDPPPQNNRTTSTLLLLLVVVLVLLLLVVDTPHPGTCGQCAGHVRRRRGWKPGSQSMH